MGIVIGMDEAGYGPNLGPLVVTVTLWEVPPTPRGAPRGFDFWGALEEAVTRAPVRGDRRLHVADSKQVYTPARGLRELERSVLCLLNAGGLYPAGFRELRQGLAGAEEPSEVRDQRSEVRGQSPHPSSFIPHPSSSEEEPWLAGCDLKLPTVEHAEPLSKSAERLQAACAGRGIRLLGVKSDVVPAGRFNRLVRACGSKGVALSRASLKLLRSVWDPDGPQPVLVVADKHGGRNRYDGLLEEVLDGRMIFRGEETKALSRYRVGRTELRFQMKAESHFPVAAASLVSKYLRELSMELFNRFWVEQVPGLKPTKGYPADARRFKGEIAEAQERLGIAEEVLWRER